MELYEEPVPLTLQNGGAPMRGLAVGAKGRNDFKGQASVGVDMDVLGW